MSFSYRNVENHPVRETSDSSGRQLSISGSPVGSALATFWDGPIGSAFDKLHPLKGKRVLVVGCGTNAILQTFLLHGAAVIALDLDPHALQFSRKAYPGANFLLADAQRLPMADQSFDITWSVSTFQYMDDIEAVIRGCRRALKPGGCSVFIENLYGNPAARCDRQRRRLLNCPQRPTMRIRRHIGLSSKDLFERYYPNVDFQVWHDWTTFLFPFADSKRSYSNSVRAFIRQVSCPRPCTAWRSKYGWIAEIIAHS